MGALLYDQPSGPCLKDTSKPACGFRYPSASLTMVFRVRVSYTSGKPLSSCFVMSFGASFPAEPWYIRKPLRKHVGEGIMIPYRPRLLLCVIIIPSGHFRTLSGDQGDIPQQGERLFVSWSCGEINSCLAQVVYFLTSYALYWASS